MSIMQIIVPGTDFEQITVNLDTDQVTNLYLSQAKNLKQIEDLGKKVGDTERSLKYRQEEKTVLEQELQQAHALLSALDIDDKTKEEEKYYQKPLSMATRIALYIAKSK